MVAFLHRIDAWLAPFVIEFQVAFLDPAADCVKLQWFFQSTPKSTWFHHSTINISHVMPPVGL